MRQHFILFETLLLLSGQYFIFYDLFCDAGGDLDLYVNLEWTHYFQTLLDSPLILSTSSTISLENLCHCFIFNQGIIDEEGGCTLILISTPLISNIHVIYNT